MPIVFDNLFLRLKVAGVYNSNDQVAPAVILWPDKDRQWEPLLARLRELLPQFLTLGTYHPEEKTGPAIWLRCMIARSLAEANWPDSVTPIIYLPGVSRMELRAVEQCPKALQPLAELQYRGVIWSQVNGRDWTVVAFLQSEDGGLGLDVAQDAATREALSNSLLKIADTDIAVLQGCRIDAPFINNLVHPDAALSLLRWMNDPEGSAARWDEQQRAAFISMCREQFGFDPNSDGVLTAGEKLGQQEGQWQIVWRRFSEAPATYPKLKDVLRQARPKGQVGTLFANNDAWPQENEQQEAELQSALIDMHMQSAADARKSLLKLESIHGERRQWVWALMGEAPLAHALEHLVALATATAIPLTGATPKEMAERYAAGGWHADAALLNVLASVEKATHLSAVSTIAALIYRPWAEEAALRLQEMLRTQTMNKASFENGYCQPVADVQPEHSAFCPLPSAFEIGCCLLFADGLRYDVAQKLLTALGGKGMTATCDWTFSALPTVTATAKPAISPVAAALGANSDAADFTPLATATGKALTAEQFRKLLSHEGFQVLSAAETGDPAGRGWTESGSLDKCGHAEGAKLARRIDEQVRELAERIQTLFSARWREIRIITDHGWLLLPGNLPKTELPAYLAESRWGRCAPLKQTSTVDMLTVPWHWNPEVQVAMAPGISVFYAGYEYAHGGISVQECVVPLLTLTAKKKAAPEIQIEAVKWIGLRCKAQVNGGVGLSIDLRTKAADSSSSIIEKVRQISSDGEASLVVVNDDLSGTAAFLVVLDMDGDPVAKMQTVVGGG